MSEPQTPKTVSPWVLWLPALVFALFVAVVAYNLRNPAERVVRSALVGKPLPEFSLPPATKGQLGLARADMADGKVRVLNVFASWCIPCAVEAPQLAQLRASGVEVVGVAIRDRPEELRSFLARHGNPFTRIGADNVSAIQFALGSSGVPESFVIDGKGVIRYQHIGEIRAEHMPMLLDQIEEARK
jgi:cytochrome c biogenesis protein CcmG, thiol:disulfide interchange protein DsbE